MTKTIDLISHNTRLTNGFGQLVAPDGETYIHVDGVRKLKLDKTVKCPDGISIPDTPQFKGLNGETDIKVSYAPHTYYLELPPGYQVEPYGTTVHIPSMGLSTRSSSTTIQMGAHLALSFVFHIITVSGSQTELCGADVWAEDGVSIPITCAKEAEPAITTPVVTEPTPVAKEAEPAITTPVVTEPTPVTKEAEPTAIAPICPEPTVSINNLKVVNGMASCDITFDAGAGSTGDIMNSSLQRYDGAKWNTSLEPLYYAFEEKHGGELHVEWEMVHAGDCVVAVKVGNTCGKTTGFERSELRWDNADAEADESPTPPPPTIPSITITIAIGIILLMVLFG